MDTNYKIAKLQKKQAEIQAIKEVALALLNNPIIELAGAWFLANQLQRRGIVDNNIARGIGNASSLIIGAQMLGADNTTKILGDALGGVGSIVKTAITGAIIK